MAVPKVPPPPPPVPTKNDAEVDAEMLRQRELAAKARGRTANILTNPFNRRPGQSALRSTTLLGGQTANV